MFPKTIQPPCSHRDDIRPLWVPVIQGILIPKTSRIVRDKSPTWVYRGRTGGGGSLKVNG